MGMPLKAKQEIQREAFFFGKSGIQKNRGRKFDKLCSK